MAWNPRCENERIITDAILSRSEQKPGLKNCKRAISLTKAVTAEYVKTAFRLYIDTGDASYIDTVRELIHIYYVKRSNKQIMRRYDDKANELVNYMLQDIVDIIKPDDIARVIIDDMDTIRRGDRRARKERITDSVKDGYTHTNRQHKTG